MTDVDDGYEPVQDALAGLRDTRFSNLRFERLGIELLLLSELKRRTTVSQRAKPERVEFFMLWLTASGSSRHSVDFVDFDVAAGSLVFAKPAQVQQWQVETSLEGWILLVEPAALLPGQGRLGNRDMLLGLIEEWPAVVQLDAQFHQTLSDQMASLHRDFDNYDQSELDNALLQNAVVGLLLRLARWHNGRPAMAVGQSFNPVVFKLLRKEVEKTFKQQWSVSQYAKHLGYSESTLNRACVAATGQSAKVLIDRRLALEAARLLIHTDASIAELSYQLGFSEPTNFVRFFARMIGATPARFREKKLGNKQ
jgi:AraC-like DNA-binding protein